MRKLPKKYQKFDPYPRVKKYKYRLAIAKKCLKRGYVQCQNLKEKLVFAQVKQEQEKPFTQRII